MGVDIDADRQRDEHEGCCPSDPLWPSGFHRGQLQVLFPPRFNERPGDVVLFCSLLAHLRQAHKIAHLFANDLDRVTKPLRYLSHRQAESVGQKREDILGERIQVVTGVEIAQYWSSRLENALLDFLLPIVGYLSLPTILFDDCLADSLDVKSLALCPAHYSTDHIVALILRRERRDQEILDQICLHRETGRCLEVISMHVMDKRGGLFFDLPVPTLSAREDHTDTGTGFNCTTQISSYLLSIGKILKALHLIKQNHKTSQPVEKLLAELMRECMSLTAQRWALEGDKRAKTRRRA